MPMFFPGRSHLPQLKSRGREAIHPLSLMYPSHYFVLNLVRMLFLPALQCGGLRTGQLSQDVAGGVQRVSAPCSLMYEFQQGDCGCQSSLHDIAWRGMLAGSPRQPPAPRHGMRSAPLAIVRSSAPEPAFCLIACAARTPSAPVTRSSRWGAAQRVCLQK